MPLGAEAKFDPLPEKGTMVELGKEETKVDGDVLRVSEYIRKDTDYSRTELENQKQGLLARMVGMQAEIDRIDAILLKFVEAEKSL